MTRPSPGDPRQTLGRRGERLAAEFLQRAGLILLERRFRLRCGEIDLIALAGDQIVFVEVKTRSGRGYGHPGESVTPAKRRRMARTALAFLSGRGWQERPCRFDVVEVLDIRGKPRIRHIPDAFRLWDTG
jgi:putative endonuclease